ncbi:protein FAM210B, mitochondrial [Brienomyrus brachyistius]|uniref:protein FAM210B, mitochondrial n=1 Tax=Brienomyrus brachyistius TaxID=42636 RepID=UPI0020B35D3E|nr:protein FAM210B, mitochondrial [Brienomyrus brachyistius]
MLLCKRPSGSVIQLMNSCGGLQVGRRDVTWILHNRTFARSRFDYGYSQSRAALFSQPKRSEILDGAFSTEARAFSLFIPAHFVKMTPKPHPAATLFTGAMGNRRVQPPIMTGPLQAGRLGGVGAAGPIALPPGKGPSALRCPATGVTLRASSAAAAEKRKEGVEGTVAEVNAADQPSDGAPGQVPQELSKAQQLKKVFKEYGAVGVAFHVGISLMSLGMCYVAVSSGIDVTALFYKLGFAEALVQSKVAAGTSTFVLAYAVHKLFAPVRISITLVSVPLLVRYFRRVGLFKPPASSPR